jgi:hypothetical protein
MDDRDTDSEGIIERGYDSVGSTATSRIQLTSAIRLVIPSSTWLTAPASYRLIAASTWQSTITSRRFTSTSPRRFGQQLHALQQRLLEEKGTR